MGHQSQSKFVNYYQYLFLWNLFFFFFFIDKCKFFIEKLILRKTNRKDHFGYSASNEILQDLYIMSDDTNVCSSSNVHLIG